MEIGDTVLQTTDTRNGPQTRPVRILAFNPATGDEAMVAPLDWSGEGGIWVDISELSEIATSSPDPRGEGPAR